MAATKTFLSNGLAKALANGISGPSIALRASRLSVRTISPACLAIADLHTYSHSKALRTPSITSSPLQQRPRLGPHHQSTIPVPSTPSTTIRNIFIQTETTPNQDALKFLPNQTVIPEDFPTRFLEYLSPRSTLQPPYPSPLASKLINVDGVSAVSYGPDFITIEKDPDANWAHIKPEVFSLITEAVTQGQPFVNTAESKADGVPSSSEGEVDSLAYSEDDDEVVSMIKELLETRIRPAIQEDGGDIDFRGFENGVVKLKLRGACRTCDSSTATLKNGIESMLMHYIEEVEEVQQIMDEEEQIAIDEFAKFEEKLKEQSEREKEMRNKQ
ncbi:HIRA-interacting protein 5 [Ascosphaera apis ARSEF 7405]|uniref:HIRA-interacting protein 5 n=1 Tax=Ascosphaera apis ARSEF 7405 TaxID=392613 RepID=A0A167UWG8_9EURO|nr:HIRA-interacting protein 5 [Ascosphaera apis ARSEF 7405]